MKKKLLFLLFTALLLPIFSVFGFCQEPFVIDDYTVNAVINPDRSYDVTERISVRFTQQSHGIIRSIPKRGAQEEYNITNIKGFGRPF